MRRLAVICALGAGIFAAFAFGWDNNSAMAASTGSLALRAAAPLPGCPLSPAFTFCNQVPGSTSAAAQFTLTASSAVAGLTIKLAAVPGLASSFAATDFTVQSTTCGAALASGASCSINVTFNPSAATTGRRSAAITVTDAAKDSAIINVAGTAAALAFAPPAPPACTQDNAFTFCDQAVNTDSGAQTFTLTAGSTVTGLTISLAAVPGLAARFAPADFTIASNSCGSTLVGGTSCTVGIQFSPTVTGLRAAALTATDIGGDSSAIYLAGNTTSGLTILPPTLPPACSPGNTFEFCNTPTGGSFPPEAFTLRNTSGVQVTGLVIPMVSIGGNFTVNSTSCLTILAANSSCTINVGFVPTATGLLQDSLVVADADGDTRAVILAGTGDNYLMTLAAAQPIEVTAAQGSSAAVSATLIPDGVFGQDGEQATFSCPATPQLPINTSCAVTPCPATITPLTATNVTITLVTSARNDVAPVPPPTVGCASYGPPPVGPAVVPPSAGPPAPQDFHAPFRWQFPAGMMVCCVFALLVLPALGLFAAGVAWPEATDDFCGRGRGRSDADRMPQQ